MQCRSGSITLKILDDGVGFDPTEDLAGHLGLRSMRERAGRLGGMLEVQSDPEHGTRVLASIPSGSQVRHANMGRKEPGVDNPVSQIQGSL